MKCFLTTLCFLLLGHLLLAEEEILPDQLTPDQSEFFEAKVRPILAEHCYDCHSNQAKKLKGKLFLDSKWGWATGGVGGPAIIPGDLVESMVIDAVRHTEELVDAMPPKYKIEDEEIAILEKWVAMGAPDPRPKVEEKEGLVEKFNLPKTVCRTLELETRPERSLLPTSHSKHGSDFCDRPLCSEKSGRRWPATRLTRRPAHLDTTGLL